MNHDRWSNLSRSRTSYQANEAVAAGRPHEMILEISARCNLRCQMCAINSDTRHWNSSGRPPCFEPRLFARLRPLFPTLIRAHLYGLGEPLLNPHLVDYIRELSGAGVETWFTTNATLIDEAKARELALAGADRISVSIDGASAQTYEAIRRGARWEALLRGLRALTTISKELGRPRVTVNFVAMASNFGELPRLVDLCAEAGVAEINAEPLFYWGEESAELACHYGRESLGSFEGEAGLAVLQEATRHARGAGIHFSTRFLTGAGSLDFHERVKARRQEPTWTCSEPWSTVFVSTVGEVRPCCLNDTVFGNLNDDGFEEIWNDAAYRAFREQHVDPEGRPPGCATCRANGRQRHSPHFAAVEPVSYRPLLALAPSAPIAGGFRLDWPAEGDVVTDPLVVLGTFSRREAWRAPWASLPPRPRLLIDKTQVYDLADAVVDGDRFVAFVPAAYVSEGAHLLSLRLDGSRDLGWDRRTVRFWQPEREGGALAATARAAAFRPLARRVRRAAIYLDGNPLPQAVWLCGRTRSGWVGAAVLDTAELAPGSYWLEIVPEGQPAARHRLVRLAE